MSLLPLIDTLCICVLSLTSGKMSKADPAACHRLYELWCVTTWLCLAAILKEQGKHESILRHHHN